MNIVASFKDKEARKEMLFNVRQVVGFATLGAGTVGYMVDHLNELLGFGYVTIGAATIVVGLVLYFANKR